MSSKMTIEYARRNLSLQWADRNKLKAKKWHLSTPDGFVAPPELVRKASSGVVRHWVKILRELLQEAGY